MTVSLAVRSPLGLAYGSNATGIPTNMAKTSWLFVAFETDLI
jgi:hypothetical protein